MRGFRLEPGHSPPNLAQAPTFLIGFIVISLSRCCLPNNEGPGPQIFFLEPPLLHIFYVLYQRWMDDYLAWEPSQYGDIRELITPPSNVWLPDFGIENR